MMNVNKQFFLVYKLNYFYLNALLAYFSYYYVDHCVESENKEKHN